MVDPLRDLVPVLGLAIKTAAQADVIVQVGARVSRTEISPWDDPLWWRWGAAGYWRSPEDARLRLFGPARELMPELAARLTQTDYDRELALVAVREKDFAAAVIGVNSFYYKLVAFAMSSFIGGVTGAILIFTFYRAVTPEQFAVNVSIQVLAMVIVGGLGSIIGCYFGVAFILLLPGIVSNLIFAAANAADLKIGIELLAHIPAFLYGVLIIGFLLFEPLGLAKIYSNLRNYFIFWPFGYARR